MKKYFVALVLLLVFGLFMFSLPQVSTAELAVEASDLEPAIDMPDLIPSTPTLRNLAIRVAALESQVVELFEKIANIELTPGPAGPAGPQGPIGVPGSSLHLYDANNQDLGIFIQGGLPEDNNTYRSFDPQSGLIVLMALNNNLHEASVFTEGSNSIYFESNDCTGTPFTHPTGVMNVIHQKIFSGGSFHYYKEINGRNIASVSRVAQSRQDVTGTCFPSSSSIPESLQLQEITLPFVEPIAWPLEIREN